MKQQEEKEIIAAIKAGDKKTFSKIYNRYKKMIYKECYIATLNKEEAKDLFQDVWVKIYLSIKRSKNIQNLKGLIYSILRTGIIDYFRKRKRTLSYEEVFEDISLPESFDSETKAELNILQNLSPFERYLIYLRFYEEKSTKEIAQLLNMSENNVRVKMHRILQKLRRLI